MHTGFARLSAEQTVEQGLEFLRTNQPEGRIVYFYVVDSENRLRGVVPTRRLLLSPLESLISEIMIPDVVALPGSATVLEACEFFILHRFLAFPVVDEKRRLIGVVDVELYTKELSDLDSNAYKDDLFQLIGVHLTQQQQASPLFAFRKRFPWLITNIAGGILAAFLVGIFEKELDETVALALFIPVVLALSESVSIQSVSLALQALHGERPSWWALAIKLRAEVATGLLLGATSAPVRRGRGVLLARPSGADGGTAQRHRGQRRLFGRDRRDDAQPAAAAAARSARGIGPRRPGCRGHGHAAALLQPRPLDTLRPLDGLSPQCPTLASAVRPSGP